MEPYRPKPGSPQWAQVLAELRDRGLPLQVGAGQWGMIWYPDGTYRKVHHTAVRALLARELLLPAEPRAGELSYRVQPAAKQGGL